MIFTSERLHRINNLVRNPRLKLAALLAADLVGMRHLIVRLDPVAACNLRCMMCYFSDEAWFAKNAKGRLTADELARIAGELFPRALQVHIGCTTEPTIYKDYPALVDLAKNRFRVPFVGFTTNGLLLREAEVARLIAFGLDEITISTHGIRRETYEWLMKGASFDRYHENLRMLTRLKRQAGGRGPKIRINYTINPDNLAELREFFTVFGDYDIATVQLRPIIDFTGTAYTNKDLTPFIAAYDEVLAFMIAECRARGITVLANRYNPTYTSENRAGYVYDTAMLRYVSPSLVWKEDFDWRAESYRRYLRRTRYHAHLLKDVAFGFEAKSTPVAFATSEVY